MLLPEKKEREYRFRLALRMGLPIFGLILVLVFTTLINNYENLSAAFYIESLLLLFVSVYFILYLIYKGFDVKITDPVSKTFTREYLFDYLKEQIKKHDRYTLILVGVDNISDINSQFGIKNGDRILGFIAQWLGEYLQERGLHDFPLGRVKGGDFVIGLEGDMQEHKVLVELLCLKSDDFKVDNIEVKISGAIVDTTVTKNLDHLIDTLFEQQEHNRYKKEISYEEIDPNELESLVIEAIEKRSISIASQDVFDREGNVAFSELFVRIKAANGKFIHQKKYMKVINKLGLTLEFDMMLAEKVFSNLDSFRQRSVALIISTSSLRDMNFFAKVKMMLDADETLRGRVLFLFSENEYFSKSDKFNAWLHSYREAGVAIGVDRLGVLHSSFLYLRDLDLDVVRFDSSYTKGEKIFKCEATIRGLDAIANAKGIRSWVKMLETKEQFEAAKEYGIDLLQGKYLSQLQEENL